MASSFKLISLFLACVFIHPAISAVLYVLNVGNSLTLYFDKILYNFRLESGFLFSSLGSLRTNTIFSVSGLFFRASSISESSTSSKKFLLEVKYSSALITISISPNIIGVVLRAEIKVLKSGLSRVCRLIDLKSGFNFELILLSSSSIL